MSEHVEDLLSLYALGGLEADELARVEAHLARCAACRRLADDEQALLAAVALATPPQTPNPRVRARLLAHLSAPAVARPPTPSWLTVPRWILAGLSLVLAVLAGWNVYLTRQMGGLQQQVQSSTRAVALMAAPSTEEFTLVGGDEVAASGQAFVEAASQEVMVVVQNMAPLPAGQVYQAWIVTSTGARSAGRLEVTGSGWGMKWLEAPLETGGWVCISREPESGSHAPTDVVLWGGN